MDNSPSILVFPEGRRDNKKPETKFLIQTLITNRKRNF